MRLSQLPELAKNSDYDSFANVLKAELKERMAGTKLVQDYISTINSIRSNKEKYQQINRG